METTKEKDFDNFVESELESRKSEAILEHQQDLSAAETRRKEHEAKMNPAPEKIVVKDDGRGNQIYAQGTGIYLLIKDAPKARRICTIDLERKTMIVNREPFERHNGFYSFNLDMLSVAKKCDTLRIICPEGTFDVPISQILLYGKKLTGNAGIQTLIYYQISEMKLFPAKS